jgi:hypothetical protein
MDEELVIMLIFIFILAVLVGAVLFLERRW